MTRPPTEIIADWYDRKTEFLLRKYGPGPRVHYHTGLAPATIEPARDEDGLRMQIIASQEEMLRRAVQSWRDLARLDGALLDVGCGLGGTSLYFASELGADVTALSPVPRHLEHVARFAELAKVSARVHPLLGDAHALAGPMRFDAAISFGATTYFDRELYFAGLARIIRPGGCVLIEDTFLGRPEFAAPFNDYWTSDIGWPDDYDASARAHGFIRERREDVSSDAAGFWKLSVAYSRLVDGDKRQRSIAWQSAIFDAYRDGGMRNLLVAYRKR